MKAFYSTPSYQKILSMLNNDQIVRCLREVAFTMKHEFSANDIHHVESNQRTYEETDLTEFKRDLTEAGNKIRILLMEDTCAKLGKGLKSKRPFPRFST